MSEKTLRFAADENFDNRILRDLLRPYPDLDIVRVQDTEMAGAKDPSLLEWTAREDRILLTHDVETMVAYAYQRVAEGLPMPGVFESGTVCRLGWQLQNSPSLLEPAVPMSGKIK